MKDLTIIVMLICILIVLEQALILLPNIQLTGMLIILYTKTVGFKKTSLIVLIYVLLDNLIMGSLNLIYTPAMLLGWMLTPILLVTVFKKVNSAIGLAFLGIIFAFIYSWCFIPANILILNIGLIEYLVSDILFEIILALSNFLAILILYDPLKKVFGNFLQETEEFK